MTTTNETPEPETYRERQIRLFAIRADRMQHLLSLNAPSLTIAKEGALIIGAILGITNGAALAELGEQYVRYERELAGLCVLCDEDVPIEANGLCAEHNEQSLNAEAEELVDAIAGEEEGE